MRSPSNVDPGRKGLAPASVGYPGTTANYLPEPALLDLVARARIRAATEGDLEALVRHRREMWRELGHTDEEGLALHDRAYRRWARQRIRTGRLVGWVAQLPDGPVVASGCVWLQPIQPRPGRSELVMPYLLSMYTEPTHRGRGLARRIVREAMVWCRDEGYARLELHAATKARPLYRGMGFVRGWEMRVRLAPKRQARRRGR